MGSTPQAVPNCIARGEPVDVVIVMSDALDKLIKDGKVVASSRSALAPLIDRRRRARRGAEA
jgi:molybdate transport system substrate-binding protein